MLRASLDTLARNVVVNSLGQPSVMGAEGTPMRHAIISLTFAASLTIGCAGALAQAGGGASGGGSTGGSSAGGGAGTSSGAGAGVSSLSPAAPSGASAPATGPAPDSSAAPSGSLSPTTGDTSTGSTIPRARTGLELGTGQPGEGTARPTGPATTGGISGRAQGTASPERVREQNERDRAIDRDLLRGGGICEGCMPGR